MQLVGFLQWRKRGARHDQPVRAKRLTRKQWGLLAAVAVAGYALAFGILWWIDRSKLASGALAEINTVKVATDAAARVFNILGQVLLSRLLQSTGKTFYSMIIQVAGAVLNIILDTHDNDITLAHTRLH